MLHFGKENAYYNFTRNVNLDYFIRHVHNMDTIYRSNVNKNLERYNFAFNASSD